MINSALCKTSHLISALTLGSSILLDLAVLSPNQKWLLWIKGLSAIFATEIENKLVSQHCNQGEPDVVSCHPTAEHSSRRDVWTWAHKGFYSGFLSCCCFGVFMSWHEAVSSLKSGLAVEGCGWRGSQGWQCLFLALGIEGNIWCLCRGQESYSSPAHPKVNLDSALAAFPAHQGTARWGGEVETSVGRNTWLKSSGKGSLFNSSE